MALLLEAATAADMTLIAGGIAAVIVVGFLCVSLDLAEIKKLLEKK